MPSTFLPPAPPMMPGAPSDGGDHDVGTRLGSPDRCCLAFTNPRAPLAPIEELDEDQRIWRERLPAPETGKRYCGTSTFRPPEQCDERQLFWLQRHHAKRRAAR